MTLYNEIILKWDRRNEEIAVKKGAGLRSNEEAEIHVCVSCVCQRNDVAENIV
jgi:hypothetical protein